MKRAAAHEKNHQQLRRDTRHRVFSKSFYCRRWVITRQRVFSFAKSSTTQRWYLPCAFRGARICPVYRQSAHSGKTQAIPPPCNSYLVVVSKVGQNTGDQSHVDEREHGMARGPAPVLVAVGIEFCGLLVTVRRSEFFAIVSCGLRTPLNYTAGSRVGAACD